MSDESTKVIFGALRSGSTLLRLMLNEHLYLHCPGEIDFIFDHLFFDKHMKKWVIDNEALRIDRIFAAQNLCLPETDDGEIAVCQMMAELRSRDAGDLIVMIHRNLEIALKLLDKPRVIHLLRDPRDVASSSVAMGWAGNVYYGADHWIRTERDWSQHANLTLITKTMTLRFEDLVSDAEAKLGEVCEFFDVSYDPRMLEYHLKTSYEPVDPTLGTQWKQKLSKSDVSLIEERVGALLEERGFHSSERGRTKLGRAKKISLWLHNKLHTWIFRVNRYGVRDILIVAIARRLRLEKASAPAKLRISEVSKKYLK